MLSRTETSPVWYDLGSLEDPTRELEFYRRLLDLIHVERLEPLLEEALRIIVELSDAQQAVLTLDPDGYGDGGQPMWVFHDCSPEDSAHIRATISRGIVAEALGRGDTVHTASALLDERFRDRQSVRSHRIEAVLCVPVGENPALGAVYLSGRPNRGLFTQRVVELTRLFARHLGQVAHRLITTGSDAKEDPTAPWRARLKADEIVGRSQAIADVLREVSLVAPLDISVLLTGASGTGKTCLARVLAHNSQRATGPFVELNCAAVPETLFESELFGARKGAYSSADTDLPGKIQAASGGTLFLDEIGELGLATQAKLLQFLQSKTYYPLGSPTVERADVRVIAATNVNLQEVVAQGKFREDLYYRLNVMPIHLPSLADREEDIPLLVRHFASQASARHGLPRLDMSPGGLSSIQTASWPSNLRGLAHAVERGLIRAAGSGVQQIEPQHLGLSSVSADCAKPASFQEATRQFQRTLLVDSLERNRWNIAETARELDLTRGYVYKLIGLHGLERPS